MIRPNKHSDPALTVLPIAGILLIRLRKLRIDDLLTLSSYLVKNEPEGEALFVPAVYLLFLLGLIEYRRKTDSLEYVGP